MMTSFVATGSHKDTEAEFRSQKISQQPFLILDVNLLKSEADEIRLERTDSLVSTNCGQPFAPNSKFKKWPTNKTSALPKLQNILSTANLNCTLNLKKIALQARNVEFNPKHFMAVIMRIRRPQTTAFVFSTGKLVCIGAKSEKDSWIATRKFARIIQKLDYAVKLRNFKICNITGNCDVKFPVRLDEIYANYEPFCSYRPEILPGLFFRLHQPRVTILIFANCKLIFTGAKTTHDISNAFDAIFSILKTFENK